MNWHVSYKNCFYFLRYCCCVFNFELLDDVMLFKCVCAFTPKRAHHSRVVYFILFFRRNVFFVEAREAAKSWCLFSPYHSMRFHLPNEKSIQSQIMYIFHTSGVLRNVFTISFTLLFPVLLLLFSNAASVFDSQWFGLESHRCLGEKWILQLKREKNI